MKHTSTSADDRGATHASADEPSLGPKSISHRAVGLFLLLGVPYLTFHHEIIWRTVRIALEKPAWSHALVVPLISAWFVRRQWGRIRTTGLQPCWWGGLVMLLGIVGYILALFPIRNAMLAGYAAVIDLLGLVWFVAGTRVMRFVWFPICYLGFAVKISDRIWELIAWRLQVLAARLAAGLLSFLGQDAQVKGAVIELWTGLDRTARLNVAEACSGLRMLMALLAMGAAFVYVWERSWWKRLLLLSTAVPVAIIVNVGRVTLTGLLSGRFPQWATGRFHAWIGTLMVLPALGLFLLAAWTLDHLFREPNTAAGNDFSANAQTCTEDEELEPWRDEK